MLYSENNKFRASFDVNGDGLNDDRDLFLLSNELVTHGASQTVLISYTELLLKRGDMNSSGTTDAADMAALYASFGTTTWLTDLNVDGAVDIGDVETMVADVFGTVPGDLNLDGKVDGADYVLWRKNDGHSGTFLQGDATFDGVISNDDLQMWRANLGLRQPLSASGSGVSLAAVPEPSVAWLGAIAVGWFLVFRRRMRSRGSASVG